MRASRYLALASGLGWAAIQVSGFQNTLLAYGLATLAVVLAVYGYWPTIRRVRFQWPLRLVDDHEGMKKAATAAEPYVISLEIEPPLPPSGQATLAAWPQLYDLGLGLLRKARAVVTDSDEQSVARELATWGHFVYRLLLRENPPAAVVFVETLRSPEDIKGATMAQVLEQWVAHALKKYSEIVDRISGR